VLSGPFGRIAVGATASYLQGIYELHVDEAYGSVTTGMMAISGEAYVSAVTAEGGAGYGLDLGAAWQAPGGWTVGLAMDNVVAAIDWNGTVERTELRVSAAEINAFNDDLDQAVSDADTTYAIDGYRTSLPRRLRLGAAHDGGTWLVAADYVQGLDDRAGTTTAPRLNVGTEWRALGWLAPRAGLSLATSGGTGIAGGLGFQAAFWQLDLAVMNRGGFSSASTKGLGFGVSTRFVF
jgi:hypothetical protein